jgi:2-hydroxychromene-2-carboxylate isomerase
MSSPAVVEFFFDLSSPYSYLAATQIEAVAQRHGASVAWRPMVLGAVFKAAGNDMPAKVAAKARYMMADLDRWARHYGVPFRMSSRFPLSAIDAMRLILVADEAGRGGALARAAFSAMWTDDRDLGSPDVLAALCEEVGLEPGAALARTKAPEVKERLRQYTDDAVARGVFGAPAMFVGNELFWGNDRLLFVEQALARR